MTSIYILQTIALYSESLKTFKECRCIKSYQNFIYSILYFEYTYSYVILHIRFNIFLHKYSI